MQQIVALEPELESEDLHGAAAQIAAMLRWRVPALPSELLPAVLAPLELRARPAAAVCKAWKAAVAELRHTVPLVAGRGFTERLRPLYRRACS